MNNDLIKLNLRSNVKSLKEFTACSKKKENKNIQTKTLKFHIKFNEVGKKIEISEYNPDGSLNKHSTFNNAVETKKVKPKHNNLGGDNRKKIVYKYDNNGKIIKTTKFMGSHLIVEKKVEYDLLGNKTMEKHYKYHGNKQCMELSFNNNGDIVEKVVFVLGVESLKVKTMFKYDYDEYNNWTNKSEYFSNWMFNTPKEIKSTTREIEY